jgi:predicted nucleic acid-binding protein
VIDSSGWLEFFFDGPLASDYAPHLAGPDVLVPTIVLYEVYKVLKTRLAPSGVSKAMAQLADRRTVPLEESIALAAAGASLTHALSMADAIIYATARHHDAALLSSDAHLAGLPGVRYLAKSQV